MIFAELLCKLAKKKKKVAGRGICEVLEDDVALKFRCQRTEYVVVIAKGLAKLLPQVTKPLSLLPVSWVGSFLEAIRRANLAATFQLLHTTIMRYEVTWPGEE